MSLLLITFSKAYGNYTSTDHMNGFRKFNIRELHPKYYYTVTANLIMIVVKLLINILKLSHKYKVQYVQTT